MTATIEERVAAGAAWLDETYPGWERVLDLGTLNLAEGAHCVLGQIGRAIGVAMGCHVTASGTLQLGLQTVSGYSLLFRVLPMMRVHVGYGFLTGNGSGVSYPSEWPALEAAWVALVKERFSADALSG